MATHDPLDLEAEASRSDAAKAAQELELRWETEDLKWLMSQKRGRRVVWRLLKNAGVYRLSFDPNNAAVTAFKEGQRNQGLRILALIQEHCAEGYGLMVQERSNV